MSTSKIVKEYPHNLDPRLVRSKIEGAFQLFVDQFGSHLTKPKLSWNPLSTRLKFKFSVAAMGFYEIEGLITVMDRSVVLEAISTPALNKQLEAVVMKNIDLKFKTALS